MVNYNSNRTFIQTKKLNHEARKRLLNPHRSVPSIISDSNHQL
jgi:hypothetical protein